MLLSRPERCLSRIRLLRETLPIVGPFDRVLHASHLLDLGQRKDLASVILKLETELWHRRRLHMSGSKRNVKAVRKDVAKVARRRIEKRTHAAGARISEVAKLLRSSVRDVHSRDSPFADNVVESIAQRLDAAGRYLSASDTDRLLADVESLAKRVPLTFTVTGFLLGFSTGRFLRASRDA